MKRKAADGREEVEVYSEHYPKSARESTWEELEPISYDGREKILKVEAEMWAKLARSVQAQREQVHKNAYKTRQEAVEAMNQEMRKVMEEMRRGISRD